MTCWLAWLHLTNFQIHLVNLQLHPSLPVILGQILLTGQLTLNFPSITVNFPSITVNFPSLPAISITFNHQVFWTPKSGPNADVQPKWKSLFLANLYPKTWKQDFPRKVRLSVFSTYGPLKPWKESDKNNEAILRKFGNWQTRGQMDRP